MSCFTLLDYCNQFHSRTSRGSNRWQQEKAFECSMRVRLWMRELAVAENAAGALAFVTVMVGDARPVLHLIRPRCQGQSSGSANKPFPAHTLETSIVFLCHQFWFGRKWLRNWIGSVRVAAAADSRRTYKIFYCDKLRLKVNVGIHTSRNRSTHVWRLIWHWNFFINLLTWWIFLSPRE